MQEQDQPEPEGDPRRDASPENDLNADENPADEPPADELLADDQPSDDSLAEEPDREADAAPPEEDAAQSSAPDGEALFNPSEGSALDELVGIDRAREIALDLLTWARGQVMNVDRAIEGAIIVGALLPAALFGPQLKKFIVEAVAPRCPQGVLRRAAHAFAHIATAIALYIVLQASVAILGALGRETGLVSAGVSLLTAWIVIRLVTLVIRSPFWSRLAFYIAWPLAALDAFGVLDNVVARLDAFAIPLSTNEAGETVDISALDVVRGLITFAAMFWIAGIIGNFLKARIDATQELTVSFKALIGKILDVLLPVVALLVALQLVNFPFGALAIFGGAIGIGVGLGLQRTVSNFAAGFTLIADKSIKPGDVIEVGDTFGWIREMNARYVAIRTRDGTSHLIPNERFIEDGVVNWSHSDNVVRLHAGIGVAYGTRDLRFVKKLCEDAARSVERVLDAPAPVCNLVEFGDSSVDFDLRFWIKDPRNGVSNVRSDVMLKIWDRLHENGIEIPFPQRDLHIKTLPNGLDETRGAAGLESAEAADAPARRGVTPA